MKLVIAVVEDDDTPALVEELTENKFQATKLASTGGFLMQGNTTLLMGIDDNRVEDVLDLIRRICVGGKKLIPRTTSDLPSAINLPIEVEAGGAIVFVVDIEDFFKL